MMRPRGNPPMPSAISKPKEPVEMTSVSAAASRDPSFIIEPLPKARSICPSAASKARCLSIVSLSTRRKGVCKVLLSVIPHPTKARKFTYTICSRNAMPPKVASWGSDTDHVSHLDCQLLQAERLGQKVNAAVTVEPLPKRVLRVSRNKDDFQIRNGLSHLANKMRPVHAWHYHVGNHQIDTFLRVTDQIQRHLPAFGLDYFVALIAECAGAKDPHRIVVLDQHDRSLPS